MNGFFGFLAPVNWNPDIRSGDVKIKSDKIIIHNNRNLPSPGFPNFSGLVHCSFSNFILITFVTPDTIHFYNFVFDVNVKTIDSCTSCLV